MKCFVIIVVIVSLMIFAYSATALYTNHVVSGCIMPKYSATLKAVNLTGGKSYIKVGIGLPYLVYGKEDNMSDGETLMVVSRHAVFLVDGASSVKIDDIQYEIWPTSQERY